MRTKMMTRALVVASGLLLAACTKEYSPLDKGALVPQTVDEDPSLPFIEVNNTRLHAETFGDPADPIVLAIHGGPGADYRYMLKARQLADDHYFVVFYDQRGSGLSRRHSKSLYSIQLMLDDMSAVIDKYRKTPGQKVFLLGHSWGGMLATAYINQYPGRINGAILAEPGGFTWPQTKDYLSRSRPSKLTSELVNDATYLDQFLTGKESDHEILDYKMEVMTSADWAADNIIGNGVVIPSWRGGAIVSDALMDIADRDGFDWTTNLRNFTTKILFIYSERNKAYGLSHAQQVSAPYPQVQLTRLPGGHDMIYEAWNSFYPEAKNYLNSLR